MTYATWLHDTICRTTQRTCTRLVDPPVDDIDRALRLLTPLVDTLEGFAIGSAIGHVVGAVRRWSGEAAGKAVLARLRPLVRSAARPEPEELAESLAGELAARLHRRLACMPVAALVAEAGAAISPVATQDDLLEPRLAAEIETGWQHYRSLVLGTRLPTTSPLWHAWDKKVRGEREQIVREYVVRVGRNQGCCRVKVHAANRLAAAPVPTAGFRVTISGRLHGRVSRVQRSGWRSRASA